MLGNSPNEPSLQQLFPPASVGKIERCGADGNEKQNKQAIPNNAIIRVYFRGSKPKIHWISHE
jgi:hypothetical protein